MFSVTILLSGVIFHSNVFDVGTVPYVLLTVVIGAFVVVSTSTFVCILGFEVYRSIRFASVINRTRDKAEMMAVQATAHFRREDEKQRLKQMQGSILRVMRRSTNEGATERAANKLRLKALARRRAKGAAALSGRADSTRQLAGQLAGMDMGAAWSNNPLKR